MRLIIFKNQYWWSETNAFLLVFEFPCFVEQSKQIILWTRCLLPQIQQDWYHEGAADESVDSLLLLQTILQRIFHILQSHLLVTSPLLAFSTARLCAVGITIRYRFAGQWPFSPSDRGLVMWSVVARVWREKCSHKCCSAALLLASSAAYTNSRTHEPTHARDQQSCANFLQHSILRETWCLATALEQFIFKNKISKWCAKMWRMRRESRWMIERTDVRAEEMFCMSLISFSICPCFCSISRAC